MAVDNAGLLKRLEEVMDILAKINEGGESTALADKAADKVELVINDLKLMIDDGK